MTDPSMALAVFILGISLGMVYFGGLRLTVALSPLFKRRSALLFVSSFLLRSAFVAAAFCFVFVIDWELLAGSLLGFLVARWAVTGRFDPA
ncbi:MAG: N-ATPase subunit AtpR [Endomicrobiales bacterium]